MARKDGTGEARDLNPYPISLSLKGKTVVATLSIPVPCDTDRLNDSIKELGIRLRARLFPLHDGYFEGIPANNAQLSAKPKDQLRQQWLYEP